ncbi:MAG: hypothetical protein RIS79_3132 [Verrucomicrobiota bacterium]
MKPAIPHRIQSSEARGEVFVTEFVKRLAAAGH